MLPSTLLASDPSQFVRGVFDVGSGSTKVNVSTIDKCLQKINAELFQGSEKVGYKQSLTDNQNSFAPTIIEQGEHAIETLKKAAEAEVSVISALTKTGQKSVQWRGIATSAFRQSKNGKESLDRFSKNTSIPFKIIPQEEEAKLGFAAGISLAKDPSKAIVWDIGGGSQQITFKESKTKIKMLMFEKGAETVKNKILQDVLKKDPSKIKTPNPIGKMHLAESQKAIQDIFPENQFDKIPANFELIGIGGVHQFSIPKATSKNESYTLDDVSTALTNYLEKDDAAIKDKYADTMVTNLILVETLLNRMRLKDVKICKYGIADGYMLVNDNWK
ncbi:MAG: hypothetical protein R2877_05880 [Bdellovibrionota bacterium]